MQNVVVHVNGGSPVHRSSPWLPAAYELIPESGKVVLLDVDLPMRQAFHALHEQGGCSRACISEQRRIVIPIECAQLSHSLQLFFFSQMNLFHSVKASRAHRCGMASRGACAACCPPPTSYICCR